MSAPSVIEVIIGHFASVGVSFENWLLLILVLGAVVFFAADFRYGLVVLFVMMSVLYVLLYALGLLTSVTLIALVVVLVLMAVSLYLNFSHTGGQAVA